MLFNSIDFALFLPIVFGIYWLLNKKSLKIQNTFLLFASYTFYGWWDWKFLTLIAVSTSFDYVIGLNLANQNSSTKRKLLLTASIFVNLGLLGFFKYANFFVESFTNAFTLFGMSFQGETLNIILPVGISFYTFQTLSYTIDIYRNKFSPTSDFLAFGAFVAFFPQLVAGPIERAKTLLPQFLRNRKFEYEKAVDGLRQILWGLFKKVAVADYCGIYVDHIFENYATMDGSMLVLGMVLFAIQIYGDFSGYTDIAIGTARLFGFELMRNFAYPFFSRDIAEFWRRWHISLTSWFKDYLYIPLGGSKVSSLLQIRNIYIVFIISGFWHGANWTFLFWGFLHALFYTPLLLAKKHRQHFEIVAKNKSLPNISELLQMVVTFLMFAFSMIFFRSESFMDAIQYISGFHNVALSTTDLFSIKDPTALMVFIISLFGIEWASRRDQHGLQKFGLFWPSYLRIPFYLVLVMIILLYSGTKQEFIYFQF